SLIFLLITHRPPYPTTLPYTTLCRSVKPHEPTRREPTRRTADGTISPSHDDSPRGQGHEPWIEAVPHAVPPQSRVRDPDLAVNRSEEHTSELQSRVDIVCRLLLEKKK